MIKGILRKGKFNDDDDCRKVEPDDIVSIQLKKCPYIVQNENQTMLLLLRRMLSHRLTIVRPFSKRQKWATDISSVKYMTHRLIKFNFTHMTDFHFFIDYQSSLAHCRSSCCSKSIGKGLLISFNCEVLNVVFCHIHAQKEKEKESQCRRHIFLSLILRVRFNSPRLFVLQTFQVLINGIIRVFIPDHLVVIIVHNDSIKSSASLKRFYLMFYSIQFHFFFFFFFSLRWGSFVCGPPLFRCSKYISYYDGLSNNQCNTACL